MRKLQKLVRLMQIEEQARTCLSREDAQRCIQRAEALKNDLDDQRQHHWRWLSSR